MGLISIVACGGGHDSTQGDAGGGTHDAPAIIDAFSDANGSVVDAPPDGPSTFGLISIFPSAASRTVDTALTITGFGINGTPMIHLVNCDQPATTYDLVASAVTSTSIATSIAASATRVQGAYTVTVTNGDAMVASLTCALHIVAEPPPTVTSVVPTTAWQGVANDSVDSDQTITLQGTGFLSTPNVRLVSTTNTATHYDAIYVGYISSTHVTAIVPSETQAMPVGTYNIYLTNPDNLTGEWLNGANAGVFTVTATPPPHLDSVSPARITNGTCGQTLTFTGSGFQTGTTLWYIVPSGTTCTGSTTDANGQTLCPFTVDSTTATSMTGHLATCPALGPYPVAAINPDGQTAYWYDIEITPSSAGHLSSGSWETSPHRLETARYKHAAQFGFDAFANSFMYVAGGQDAAGNVLASVEVSQFDLFGTPGPFTHAVQYGGPATPRVANALTVAREGTTLVRVGKSMFSIGGTTTRSDSTTPVAASNVVERAEILGYNQMPAVKQPTVLGGAGLPLGSWYYSVSAVGPGGESLATREVVAINKAGQIQVCWVAPVAMNATSYNIYRSLASDGRANTSTAIAYEVTSGNLCFNDTGTEKLAPAPGDARGSLVTGGTNPAGTYTYRVSATVPLTGGATFETYAGYAASTTITATDVANAMQTVSLAWNPLPIANVSYRVYRLDSATNTYKLVTGGDALTATTFSDGGIAFDPSNTAPRADVRPLPTGSLSKWAGIAPHLGVAREGLDGVVVTMDPVTSNNLVARILVAGGRDGAGGTYSYFTSAESLGIYQDGTTETSWYAELPAFSHARAYYPLLTTQDQNSTPFPPPADPPPCGDCTVVVQKQLPGFVTAMTSLIAQPLQAIAAIAGSQPVYIVAAEGDDAFQITNNAGRTDFESCPIEAATGHLAANCGITNATTWVVQTSNEPAGQQNYGLDGVLYFSYLYPFAAIARETVANPGTMISFLNSAIGRFPLFTDLTAIVSGQILQSFQSASTSFNVTRAYYQMSRLLAYVYVIGGYAPAYTDPFTGLPVAAGPTDLVERHQQ